MRRVLAASLSVAVAFTLGYLLQCQTECLLYATQKPLDTATDQTTPDLPPVHDSACGHKPIPKNNCPSPLRMDPSRHHDLNVFHPESSAQIPQPLGHAAPASLFTTSIELTAFLHFEV